MDAIALACAAPKPLVQMDEAKRIALAVRHQSQIALVRFESEYEFPNEQLPERRKAYTTNQVWDPFNLVPANDKIRVRGTFTLLLSLKGEKIAWGKLNQAVAVKGPNQWGFGEDATYARLLERVPAPVPADYVLGMDRQRVDFEAGWPFYVNGEWEHGGKWWFYLYALLLKVPLGTLALFAAAIVLFALRQANARWREEVQVIAPSLALLVLVSSQTGLNYFRYALPALPFLLLFLARVALRLPRLSLALVILSAASALFAVPHQLAYFNEAAGGPARAHRHLVDSNIDWGQDLLRLKEWLDVNAPGERIGLAYFGGVDARVIGIDYELPPAAPRPGLYAVSIHFVQGGTFPAFDGRGRRRIVAPGAFAYFQQLTPIARAGHTILIFRLDAPPQP